MLNARIRKRWRAGNFPIALIGEKADLTYPYDYLGAGPETLGELADGKFARSAQERRAAADDPRRRRAGAAGWRGGCLRWRRRSPASSASSRTAGTASPFCTPPPRASARSISASCRARAARPPPRWPRARVDVLFLLGADEIEVAPGAFVVYIGTPWRPRRASRRRDPAGRGLSGEIRRSTSTPKAACRWRTAPRSRPAMRARTGRSCARCPTCSAPSCLTTRSRSCAGAVRRASASDAASTRSRPAMPPTSASSPGSAATPTRRRSLAGERLLSDQSDRARLRGDGRMLGARAMARQPRRRRSRAHGFLLDLCSGR